MFKQIKKKKGRPTKNTLDPFYKMMRISKDLHDFLQSEKLENETLNQAALRVIRNRGKEIIALQLKLKEISKGNE